MFAKRINLALAAAALSALLWTSAGAQSASKGASSSPQLEGTWVAAVDLLNPPPFLPEEFTALETYSRGGGMITSNNTGVGPGQGSWERSGDGYTVTILFFTFDPGGAHSGSIRVRHSISLDGRGEYSGQGVAEVFDTAGNLLGSVSFNSQGRRLAPAAP